MIELGCGARKSPGFLGLDRFPLKGVDIIADLNKALPFEDNSVDAVLACHSLEHLSDLYFTMSEIYRICRHGAILMILAPYCYSTTNVANPYHRISFNESTFQFFSNYPNEAVGIDPEDYYCPHAKPWGLGHSDNSDNQIDLGLVGIEFFYAKEYAQLPVEEQRNARRSLNNVCDQLYYRLVVNKSGKELSKEELYQYARLSEELTPERIKSLRNRREPERGGLIEDIRRPLSQRLDGFEEAFVRKTALEDAYQKIQTQCAALSAEVAQRYDALVHRQEELRQQMQAQYATLSADEVQRHEALIHQQEKLHQRQSQMSSVLNENRKSYAQLEDDYRVLYQQFQKQSAFLVDTIKRQERGFLSRLELYRPGQDLTADLEGGYSQFIEALSRASAGKTPGILSFSSLIPWTTPTSYAVQSSSGTIQVFFSGVFHDEIIAEAVQAGAIVWQKRISLAGDAVYMLDIGCKGGFDLRFRVLTPGGIVRVLERHRRHQLVRRCRELAYVDIAE